MVKQVIMLHHMQNKSLLHVKNSNEQLNYIDFQCNDLNSGGMVV